MRQLIRVVRVVWAIVSHGLYLQWKLRRIPPEEQDAYRAHRQQVGARLICRIIGLPVTSEGAVPEGGAMLAVSNHFGILDPVILATQIPAAIVGKAELARWPLIGWMAAGYGLIFVDRERRTTTSGFVDQVRRKLRHGVRVLVFPEGTTFRGGRVHPFKTGGFAAVAGMDDAAVLPMYLAVLDEQGRPATLAQREQLTWAGGTQPFLENAKGLLRLRGVCVHVCIGRPIPTAGLNRKELAARAQAAVAELSLPYLPPDAPVEARLEDDAASTP